MSASASASGAYANTNYYFDDSRRGDGYLAPVGLAGAQAVVQNGVSSLAVSYTNVFQDLTAGLAAHLTNGINVSGYFSWGYHSALGDFYATNGNVRFTGNSSWYLLETVESFNGQRVYDPRQFNGNKFIWWFVPYAFGGSSYSCTPVCAVSHTDEPYIPGVNDNATLFTLWAQRKTLAFVPGDLAGLHTSKLWAILFDKISLCTLKSYQFY